MWALTVPAETRWRLLKWDTSGEGQGAGGVEFRCGPRVKSAVGVSMRMKRLPMSGGKQMRIGEQDETSAR